MAYHKPQNIDDFVLLMAKADMRVKAQLAEDLVVYLSDMENSIVSNDLGLLVDNLMPWLIGSHFKVSFNLRFYYYLRSAYYIEITHTHRLPMTTETSYAIRNCVFLIA